MMNDKFNLFDPADDLFTEAVFADGKKQVQPIEESLQKVKDRMMEMIKEQNNSIKGVSDWRSVKWYSPEKFWRDPVFKELEDQIEKIFGFRRAYICAANSAYSSKRDEFDYPYMNAYVMNENRFPIEGLVSDKGFYDKTHSMELRIVMTPALIYKMEANEMLAVLLHEIGHGIDPALVTISYTETTILSKYLTDRESEFTNFQKNHAKKLKIPFLSIFIKKTQKTFQSVVKIFAKKSWWDKRLDKRIEHTQKVLQKDQKREFNHRNFMEAYADNFARMYGYGPALSSALHKFSKEQEKLIISRYALEMTRQAVIVDCAESAISDCHKTDVHRMHALIREYENDMKDPDLPPKVKKQLEEDCNEVRKVLDMQLNSFSDMQNRVNKLIEDELTKGDEARDAEAAKNTEESEDDKKDPNKKEEKKNEKKSA